MRHAFVVPCYGAVPYLDACLDSLRGQVGARSEILLATSTPSAEIAAVAQRHGVAVITNPERTGIAGDWNFALRATTADLVTLAHQDDVYDPHYAQAVRDRFACRPHAVMAFAAPAGEDRNALVKRLLCRLALFGSGQDELVSLARKRALLRFGNPVCCPSVTVNRSAVPGFAFPVGMASNLDWAAWTDLATAQGSFLYLSSPLVAQRIHGGTTTNATLVSGARQREDRLMFERLWGPRVGRCLAWLYQLSYSPHRGPSRGQD